eukprot:COSAG05_NODE_3041_length_2393_cov_149.284912_2_plen_239_part_00
MSDGSPKQESSLSPSEQPGELLSLLQLSQRSHDEGGMTLYNVVVSVPDSEDELLHEYCAYHPMAGPVRPDRVYNLQLSGANVTWEWSENAFDLASPGAYFQRPLTIDAAGRLAWSGPVARTAKKLPRPKPPTQMPAAAAAVLQRCLLPKDLVLKQERRTVGLDDEVKVLISHAGTNSSLEWIGESTAESQSVRSLNATVVQDNMVRIDFIYQTAENGSRHAINVSKFVQLGPIGIKWA